MTNWKMPEWMEEIYTLIIGADLFDKDYYEKMKGKAMGFDVERHIMLDLRAHELLSTPTERDGRQKKIKELEAEVERLRICDGLVSFIRKATYGYIDEAGYPKLYVVCQGCGKPVDIKVEEADK